MRKTTMPERAEWARTLAGTLLNAERLRGFIGDDRAAGALLAERAVSVPGHATAMDAADFADLLRARVDVDGMPARELIRWDV